jgi:hypothetical protein
MITFDQSLNYASSSASNSPFSLFEEWYWFIYFVFSEQIAVIFILVIVSPWRPAQRDRRLEAFKKAAEANSEASSLLARDALQ